MTAFFVFLRMFSLSALWLGCGGLVLSRFLEVSDMTLLLPVLGLCAMAAYLLGKWKRPARFAALVLLACALPLCRDLGDQLLAVPALFYIIYCVAKDRLVPVQTDVFYQFYTVAIIALAGSLLSFRFELDWTFLCFILSVVMHLFLTRMLRHSVTEYTDRRLIGMELLLLVLFCVVALLFSRSMVVSVLSAVMKGLFYVLIYPVIMLVLMVFMGVVWAVNWVMSKLFPGTGSADGLPTFETVTGAMKPDFIPEDAAGLSPVVIVVVLVLGLIVFLTAGFLLLRFLRNSILKAPSAPADVEAKLIPEGEWDRVVNSRPWFLDRSPQAGVRRAYASYCAWLKKNGTEIAPCDTTRSVNCLAGLEDDDAAGELRSLYLAARYTGQSTLTKEDARRAASLAREIIRGMK